MEMQNNETERNGSLLTTLLQYCNQNGRWVRPLVSTLMLIGSIAMYKSMAIGSIVGMPAAPDWAIPVAATIGLFVAGFGAATTRRHQQELSVMLQRWLG